MSNKNASTPRQQESSHVTTSSDTSIVTDGKKLVKAENAIQRLRIERHIPVTDMVEVIRTLYPGYDKPLHSKVENGMKYGIRLRDDAEKLLLKRFAAEAPKRRSDGRRRKPNRIQARVSDNLFALLQRHISDAGITMQDFIESLIVDFITKKE